MSGNAIKNDGRLPGKSFWAGAAAILHSSKWQRRAAWAVVAWLLLWALTYALVPVILKSQLEKIGSEKLGRQLTVGAVEFKPWSLELTIHDLAIARAASAASAVSPQLKIKRIYIDAELESLWHLAPVADAIRVEEPALSLSHLGQGRYDIDDILERLNTPAAAPAAEPLKFSLYNVELSAGRMDFVDQAEHKTHALRELHFAVPFLSNLPSRRDVRISPHLAFKLDGGSFDTAAEGTPFAQTRKTEALITLHGLDLKPYLDYWPASLPFRLHSAVLQADVKLAFELTPATVLRISGTVSADKVLLLDAKTPLPGGTTLAASPELLAFDRLQIRMDDVRPLEQFVKLSSVELTAPTLSVTRDRAGRLNLLPPESQPTTKSIASEGRTSRATGQNNKNMQAGAAPWKLQLGQVVVRGGRVNWLDETLASPARIRLGALTLDASAIVLPFTASAPLQFKGSLGLDAAPAVVSPVPVRAQTAAAEPAGSLTLLSFQGTATDQVAKARVTVAAWPLAMAAKYVGQFLLPELNGQLDAELDLNWQAATADQPQRLQVSAPRIAVSDVQLAQGKTSLVSVKRVALAAVEIDLPGQTFKAASMQLNQPRARVERGSDQRWMYEHWLVANGPAMSPAAPKNDGKTRANTPSWAVSVNDVQFDGGSLSYSDKAGAKPVAFEVTAARAQLGGLVLDDRPANKALAARPMPLSLSLRLAAGRLQPGKLDFKGSVGLAPLQVKGQLEASRLPVQAFEPYFGAALNIALLRADASFKGRLAYRQTPAGPQAEVAGDVVLEEFKANTLAPSEDLLAWKALNVRGLRVVLAPARATRVDVRETVLSDFFARVIVMPDGRINLQDLLKPANPAAPAPASGPPVAAGKIALDDRASRAKGLKGSETVAPAALAPTSAAAAPTGLPPIVNFGPISLIKGRVQFSDRFIKPNYSADLSELTGKLSAFSSVASPGGALAMADLELRGKAEETASLEILGKLNPLAKPLALDITGKVRDLELPPLSPYAVKYAGYGIERGKLSVDVNYVVLPDGRLTASNKLVLNQLSFGDKVQGSTASLPVKLAVALLADRNGVIDLDLPINGSLNDPQFSLGPIIVKVILNVIVKAITAPFSLLAHALAGGGEELSMVGFPAGGAQLSSDAKSGLDKVARALVERPALRLTVVGTSSLEAEREGFKRERLDELVRAEKRRQLVKEGVKEEGKAEAASASVSPAEYPALLKQVYQRADFPKPRNLIGLTKDQPVPEMEKLLLAGIKADDNAMHELAVQRGVAVRDYLASRDLPTERLFLGAVKTGPPEAKWTPRAELNLAMP